jgi:hypothetical protein
MMNGIFRSDTGWTTEVLEFEYRSGQRFSFLYVVQTDSGVCGLISLESGNVY